MIIFTIQNKFGYNEELAFVDTPLAECLQIFKKHDLKPLTIKDTEAKEVFTILF